MAGALSPFDENVKASAAHEGTTGDIALFDTEQHTVRQYGSTLRAGDIRISVS